MEPSSHQPRFSRAVAVDASAELLLQQLVSGPVGGILFHLVCGRQRDTSRRRRSRRRSPASGGRRSPLSRATSRPCGSGGQNPAASASGGTVLAVPGVHACSRRGEFGRSRNHGIHYTFCTRVTHSLFFRNRRLLHFFRVLPESEHQNTQKKRT